MNSFTAHLRADSVVVFHCDHGDDTHSFRIGDLANPVYLTGTFDELMTFAHVMSTTVERARYQRELIALEK